MVTVGLLPLLSSACTLTGSGVGRRTLEVSRSPYSKDVPVPVGFELVEKAPKEQTQSQGRYLHHQYEGRADKSALRSFYLEQMPLVRWSCERDTAARGRYTMRFTRGGEACTVEISGGRTVGRVLVSVRITPRQDSDSVP